MKKITVYSGESIQDKCGPQLHTVTEVLNAQKLVLSDKDETVYSNSTDFISAVKYIGKKNNVQTEFFLNGKCHGDNIEPVFEDLNRALDLIRVLGDDEVIEQSNLIELVYCYQKLEKTVKVDAHSIIPSYGNKVNEFNEFLKVVDVRNDNGKIVIKLEQF